MIRSGCGAEQKVNEMQTAMYLLLIGIASEPIATSRPGESPTTPLSAVGTSSPVASAGERYILLDSDRVTAGKVTENGDDYLVERRGARVVVPKWRAQIVADSLEEIYRYRSQRIPVNDVPMRADFAKWCFEQGLVDFALSEAQLILSLDPTNDTAKRVMKLCQPEPKVARDQPTAASTSNNRRLRQPDPTRVVSQFKLAYGQDLFDQYKRMEPMLRGSCGSSACHGSRHEGPFRIFSRTNSTGTDISLTARNLRSLLDSIDYSDPQRSAVLFKSLERHGSSSLPPLSGVQDPTYIQLQEWVHEIAHRWSGNEIPVELPQGEELTEQNESEQTKDPSFAHGRRTIEPRRFVRRTGRPTRPMAIPGEEMEGMPTGFAAADDSPATSVEKMPRRSDDAARDETDRSNTDASTSWPEKRMPASEQISPQEMSQPLPTVDPSASQKTTAGPVRRAMNRFMEMVGGKPRIKAAIPIEGSKPGEVFQAAPPPLSLQEDFTRSNTVLETNPPVQPAE
jgi:hypothetical protein